jgi:RNA polymerase sigma-70 factor (ECF subfamily)
MVGTSAADDVRLVRQAVAGDARALEELVEQYEPRVYRFAMRVCRNKEDAREILQTTFLNAIRSLRTFRGDSQFATWIFRIVVNSCRKMRGKRGAVAARELSLDPSEEDPKGRPARPDVAVWSQDPEANTLSAELRAALEAGIDRLGPGYKGVFLLRDLESFSTQETAEILRLTPQAVKTRLHRARLMLREQLADYVAEP